MTTVGAMVLAGKLNKDLVRPIDGRVDHALLRAVLTEHGSGTTVEQTTRG